MGEWQKAPLGEVSDLNWGDTKTTKSSYVSEGHVAFSASGPDGFLPYFDYNRTGIVLSAIGSECGKTWLAKGKWSCIKNTIRFFSKSAEVDTEFLYWATRSQDFWPKRGSGQPFISQGDARSCVVRFPSLQEQKDISAVLGSLDDKIELNRRMNETLEAMARALFKDWFVDFGPTRAKMQRREAYLAREIWDLFPDTLDADGIPNGWAFINVGKVIELLDSKRIPLSSREREKRKGPYPYYGATSIMDYIDDYLFDEVLLLLGEDGSVVRADGCPYTQYVWGKIWVNNHAHVIRGVGVSVEQLKCFFDSTNIMPFVTGAVQLKLNQTNLKRVQFLEASSNIHYAFDEIVAPWFSKIRLNEEEIKSLTQTRDLLLPKLMSGEIRVSESETAGKT